MRGRLRSGSLAAEVASLERFKRLTKIDDGKAYRELWNVVIRDRYPDYPSLESLPTWGDSDRILLEEFRKILAKVESQGGSHAG